MILNSNNNINNPLELELGSEQQKKERVPSGGGRYLPLAFTLSHFAFQLHSFRLLLFLSSLNNAIIE